MINMTLSGRDRQTVRLLPHKMMMNQSLDMTLFVITHWFLTEIDTNSPEEGIMMMVTLKRKIAKEIMTTYVPTGLLMMITLATIFIKQYYFEAALGTNLTTMLMMTTIFMTVMAELPSTAYVKHVDLWLIGCQLVPFLEVLLLITIEALREEKDDVDKASESVAVDSATSKPKVDTVALSATESPGDYVPVSNLSQEIEENRKQMESIRQPTSNQFPKVVKVLETTGKCS